jgi:RecA-family ATPase
MLNVVSRKYPPIRWLIVGAIQPGTFNILIGPGTVGKTRFAYGLASTIVSDEPYTFVGYRRGMNPPGHVMYYDTETVPREVRPRIAPHNLTQEALDRIEYRQEPFDMKRLNEVRLAIHKQDTDLLIIDPWLTLKGGSSKTNDNRSVATQDIQPLIALAKETGVAILAICHTSKSFSRNYHNDRGDTDISAISTSALGASALFNLAQTRMLLEAGHHGIGKEQRVLYIGGKELQWKKVRLVLDGTSGLYRFPLKNESNENIAYRAWLESLLLA